MTKKDPGLGLGRRGSWPVFFFCYSIRDDIKVDKTRLLDIKKVQTTVPLYTLFWTEHNNCIVARLLGKAA